MHYFYNKKPLLVTGTREFGRYHPVSKRGFLALILIAFSQRVTAGSTELQLFFLRRTSLFVADNHSNVLRILYVVVSIISNTYALRKEITTKFHNHECNHEHYPRCYYQLIIPLVDKLLNSSKRLGGELE